MVRIGWWLAATVISKKNKTVITQHCYLQIDLFEQQFSVVNSEQHFAVQKYVQESHTECYYTMIDSNVRCGINLWEVREQPH